MSTFEGRTVDADAPFLGAEFWKEGVSVTGIVTKVFETQNVSETGVVKKGKAYQLRLDDPVVIDGEEWDRASVGNLAGFKMALDVAKVPQLVLKDSITIVCEGVKAAKKEGYSGRINFKITVSRG